MLLDQATHSTLRDASAAPDLDRVVRDLATTSREVVLEEGHRTGEGLRLLCVGELGPAGWGGVKSVGSWELAEESQPGHAHLVGDVLEPSLAGINLGNHLGEPSGVRVKRREVSSENHGTKKARPNSQAGAYFARTTALSMSLLPADMRKWAHLNVSS